MVEIIPVINQFVFIGDVHAEDRHLEMAIEEGWKMGADTVLCTGDIPDGKGDPDRCCIQLMEIGAHTVRGNHERWLLEGIDYGLTDSTPKERFSDASIEYLERLPTTLTFQSPVGEVMLCHGLHENDMGKANFEDLNYILDQNYDLQALLKNSPARLVLNGHTHHFQVGNYQSRCFINAGTIRRDHNPSFHVINLEEQLIQSYSFNSLKPKIIAREKLVLNEN